VMGFAVGTGSQTSHTAILARSMKIPAIFGVKNIHAQLADGDLVVIDGYTGTIVLHPTESTVAFYRRKEEQDQKRFSELTHESRLRPETLDGYSIQLAANIDGPDDIDKAKQFGAAGIGLYRTEYLFLRREVLPDEEEQFAVYRDMLSGMDGRPVIIRTIDVGGDKLRDTLTALAEPNPFLGLRAVRLCLRERRDLLRTQLRALLRAGVYGNLKILFPMICCTEEVEELKHILTEIRQELKGEGIPFSDHYEIGIMIEIPAAAIVAGTLAEMVDFFSIGSNDLIQYTLAVDRSNDKVAYLYQPAHPAVLNLIMMTVTAAKKKNIWVSLCGEMAADPLYLPLLLGLGIHELSMTPVALGAVRRVIRRLHMHEAQEVARLALESHNATEVLNACRELVIKADPEIFRLEQQSI
ncbi:MAG: phosphoenolpyruvate--protein phosphotransferase, partial [Victivallales bacterium]|nr:phosphoenolpyruvate--protein phosphotransferase [Victivallales bacterium]